MADPLLDELNATTLKEVYPAVVSDAFFLDTPELAYFRDHCMVPFEGGAFTQNTFLYAPMIGGFYAKGDPFNTTKRQTLATANFDMRYLEVGIPEYKETLDVENKGPLAVFRLVDIDLRNAMQTASAMIAVGIASHGQPSSTTGVIGNRPKAWNGWDEAINDGRVPGWDSSYFITYGGATRNGVTGSSLNGHVFWCGDQSGNAGMITYNQLLESYMTCSRGRKHPDLGVGNKAVISYIKERMQVQQRFSQEKDPIYGVMSFKFENASILWSDYFPSLKYGKNDTDLGNWLTGSFTSPAANQDGGTSGYVTAESNMPAAVTCTVGEVFNWYHTPSFLMRISNSREYGFGFSGFKEQFDTTKLFGTIKAAGNFECTEPWLQGSLYGING